MGNETSHHNVYSANDFELVIRLSKHLEHLLTVEFNTTGNGLGEKIRSARIRQRDGTMTPLPRNLINNMNKLNRERNKLIHDINYNAIASRSIFISEFEESKRVLMDILAESRRPASAQRNDSCLLM